MGPKSEKQINESAVQCGSATKVDPQINGNSHNFTETNVVINSASSSCSSLTFSGFNVFEN